jgi:hypothetical protein
MDRREFLSKNGELVLVAVVMAFMFVGISIVSDIYADEKYADISDTFVTAVPEPACVNRGEVRDFEKPVPITWIAKMDECLLSCEGGAFTRIPKDEKYPRFAGYYQGVINSELWANGASLKISGDWVGIGPDHFRTVFNDRCVPIVHIKKIELVK